MSNFEAAVDMSLNSWVASFPTEFDLPEPTEAYKTGIAKLMDKMRGDRYHKLTRSTARIILIAAIIMAITTVAIAATVGRDYIVQKFKDHSTYTVADESDVKSVEDINISYLPEGFIFDNKEITDYSQSYVYTNGTYWISIYKTKIDAKVNFESEHKNSENISINAYEGVYFESGGSAKGVIWNNGIYIYEIEGNISKEEMLKTAKGVS